MTVFQGMKQIIYWSLQIKMWHANNGKAVSAKNLFLNQKVNWILFVKPNVKSNCRFGESWRP